MEQHVEFGKRGGGGVLLLSVERRLSVGCLAEGTQQQRTAAAGHVVDGVIGTGEILHVEHLGHHTAHLGGGVELTLALATLGGEVLHQILVGIAQQVIIGGTVEREVQFVALKFADEFGECLHLGLSRPEFGVVVEVGQGETADEGGICLAYRLQLLVDFLSDMRILLQCHEVLEVAAVGNVEFHLSLTGLVG